MPEKAKLIDTGLNRLIFSEDLDKLATEWCFGFGFSRISMILD